MVNTGTEKTADRILIVDDEQEWLDILVLIFTEDHWEVSSALSGLQAYACLREKQYDLVLCDMSMPEFGGIDLLKKVRAQGNETPFIIMTGIGTIRTAVEAVQFGAYNYITKPFKSDELKALALQALEHGRMHQRLKSEPSQAAGQSHGFPLVLGASKVLQDILYTVRRVASAPVPVLIQGETGTGKSLLARHIHNASPRRDHPFLTIDCGALPENLLESELFGHTKGAFTGAATARRGLLAEAEGGTIFLDEIGELPPSMQLKLLHALQEKEIRALGSNQATPIHVRFICATNRNLTAAVAAGEFRKDLYYRLAVIPITLPPLRERKDDIVLFVGNFVKKFNEIYDKNISQVSPAALNTLMTQSWEGNVRELENVIERAVLLTDTDSILPAALGLAPQEHMPDDTSLPSPQKPGELENLAAPSISLQQVVAEAERKAILLALTLTDNNRKKAAIMLGIGRRTLYQKLDEYGLELLPRNTDAEKASLPSE